MMFEHLDRAALEAALRDTRFGEEYKERIRAELAGRGGGSQKPAPSSTLARPRPASPALSAPSCTLGRAPVLRLVLYGPPRTKKNSLRRKMIGHQLKSIPSAAWCAWLDALRETRQLPISAPLPPAAYNCRALFYRHANVGDLDGYMHGLADVLQGGGVLTNDVQIRGWDGTRLAVDRACPRVEVELWPLDDSS